MSCIDGDLEDFDFDSPDSSPEETPNPTPDNSGFIKPFKVITTDEVVSQMNQVINSVSEILKVSSQNNI